MGTFVAMLRSINVGGRNRVPMAALEDLVSSLGFRDVATYVQSGNAVFTGTGSARSAGRAIGDRLATELGVTVPVIVRTAQELGRVVEGNPLADLDPDPRKLHVTFLSDAPDPAGLTGLDELGGRSGRDRFGVVGREIYLHCPGGYGVSKLNNAFFERRLGVAATTRSWRTVLALAEMAGVPAAEVTADTDHGVPGELPE